MLCYHCQSDQLIKNGLSALGKQRYRCSRCGRRSTADPDPGLTPEKEAEILRLLNERMSQRGIARALKVSRQSIVEIIKKNDEACLSGAKKNGVRYLERTLLPAQGEEILELDEMWTFVGSKENQVWIWIALCRRTRQIVGWWYGPRDALSCHGLWQRIPDSYKGGVSFTDLWDSYCGVVPPEQHVPSLKKEGQTNHIERFNLTLRQSVARLVRKTLSFSKKLLPLLRALRAFFVAYNLKMAKRYRRQLHYGASPFATS